jgi:hypothetical protein
MHCSTNKSAEGILTVSSRQMVLYKVKDIWRMLHGTEFFSGIAVTSGDAWKGRGPFYPLKRF